MTLRILVWGIIATCLLGWWLPHLNTGLRYTTILILVAYTGIAAILAFHNTVFRRVTVVCGAGSIGLVFAPAWLIPVVAIPVILLTGAYLYAGIHVLRHYVRHGQLPTAEADQVEGDRRRGRPADTAPAQQRRPHGRQMEPDLDTDSLTSDTRRPPMNVDDTRLLDCAHVGQLAGICQYEGCANQMCGQCTATCDICNILLCPQHQVTPAGQRVFCPAHISRYLAKRLLTALADRL